jgi:hypothetical protein
MHCSIDEFSPPAQFENADGHHACGAVGDGGFGPQKNAPAIVRIQWWQLSS